MEMPVLFTELDIIFMSLQIFADAHQGISETGVGGSSLAQFMGTSHSTNIGLATIVSWALPLLLLASWRQCIEKSASIIWIIRGVLRNTQLYDM